jgi:DNA replication initiation complex subunit (GINS family)
MIDILTVLEEKTRGNLTAEERQLIEQVLFELRMRFVEINGSDAAAAEPKSRIILP